MTSLLSPSLAASRPASVLPAAAGKSDLAGAAALLMPL
jgi:hypothetical protein